MSFRITRAKRYWRSYRIWATCPCGTRIDLTSTDRAAAEYALDLANRSHEDPRHIEAAS